jgi:hypothetical protein
MGLAVGGVALATADEQPGDTPSATPEDQGNDKGDEPRWGMGPGHRGWFAGGDRFAEQLAEELDIDQAEVEAALEAIREELEANRPDREELDLDNLREELRTRIREHLVERLDEAVAEGTLTEQDKASVLKAFDAEVIGGLDRAFHRMPDADDTPEESEEPDSPES